MSRLQSKCLIAAVIVVIVASCILLFIWRGADRDQQPLTAVTTIGDFSIIPQNIAPFAAAFNAPLSADEQHQVQQHFRQQHFAPWTATAPIFNADTVNEGIKQLAALTWYGETRLPIEAAQMQRLVALADMERFPSRDQQGIVVQPAFIRVLPTNKPFFESADDYPFDHLQFSEIRPNEPVRILHTSADGAWIYIETSYANGWVDPNAIRLIDTTQRKQVMDAEQLVIVHDFVRVQTEQGAMLPQPKIGTLYPLVQERQDDWLVQVAIAANDQQAVLTTVRIAKADARRHPLPLNPETLTLIGDELLKTSYGWGDMYRNRDCSATTRDFFLSFGIWLPRNSHRQINSGPLVSLTKLSSADKEVRIRDQAIPFRTLLHHKGHIMLYVGLHQGKPIILHTIWALRYRPNNGTEQKFIIAKTILSTLVAGEELSLTKGTTLSRLDSLLILPGSDQ